MVVVSATVIYVSKSPKCCQNGPKEAKYVDYFGTQVTFMSQPVVAKNETPVTLKIQNCGPKDSPKIAQNVSSNCPIRSHWLLPAPPPSRAAAALI